jgi:hypothetical protein
MNMNNQNNQIFTYSHPLSHITMDWKAELINIENSIGTHQKQSWQSDLRLIRHLSNSNKKDVELSVRVIYLLHNVLTEEDYLEDEHGELSALLQKAFKKSFKKFSNNAEYLFFIGKILYIDEWLFGIDDGKKPLKEKLAFQMQIKSHEMEPDNMLFEWAVMLSEEKFGKAVFLANELLQEDSRWNKWLQEKGFPGKYILEEIQNYYDSCRAFRKMPAKQSLTTKSIES